MTANDTEEVPTVWLGLGEVATRYGKSVDTIGRWISTGVWRNGRLVQLRAVWLGGRRAVRDEWLQEFMAACNDVPGPISVETTGEEQRRRQQEQANLARKLKGKG